jgi:transposase InsO family protein
VKDEDAFVALSQSVPDSMVMALAEYDTVAEAWEAIRRMRVGEDRVKKARVKQLKRQLDRLEMDDGETVTAFSQKLTTLVAEIRSLGEKITDEAVIDRLFSAVPSRFTDVVNTIEQWGDLTTMYVAEAVGRLASHEENQHGRRRSGGGKEEQLMLMSKALEQLLKGKKGGDNAGSSSSPAGKKGGDHGKPGKDQAKQKKKGKFDIAKVRCYNCNEKGHFQSDCPQPKKEKVNLVEMEEDNPALLMFEACELSPETESRSEQVLLNEEKVRSKLTGNQDNFWYLDTGASNHMTGCSDKFAELDETVNGQVKFGDGNTVEICGRGSVLMQCHTGEHRVLTDVYFIPRLKSNIISLGQLDEIGCNYSGGDGVLTVWDKQRRILAKVNKTKNRMYILNLQPTEPVCLLAHAKEQSWLWHMRFGHVNFRALRSLAAEGMVNCMPVLEQVEQVCDGCMLAKQRRSPFPAVSEFRASQRLQLVHSDLCGPITPATPGGKRYFLLVVDDFSRYMWLALLSTKDEALEALKKIQKAAEAEKNLKLKSIRTDRGGEFTSDEFASYCNDHGIKHFLTAPYTPLQNGVVERRNQTMVSMARSLLKSMGVLAKFWGEAVTTAVYLLNRSPTKSVKGMTPYEAWHGNKPSVGHLRTFGCVAHVKKVGPGITKLSDRSSQMVFIGYEQGSKAYRMYDTEKNRLVVTRDVVFEEDRDWEWHPVAATEPEPESVFTVHYLTIGTASTRDNPAAIEKTPESAATGEFCPEQSSPSAPQVASKTCHAGHGTTPPMELTSPSAAPAGEVSPGPSQALESPWSEPSLGPQGKRLLREIYEETEEVEAEYSNLCFLGQEEPATF